MKIVNPTTLIITDPLNFMCLSEWNNLFDVENYNAPFEDYIWIRKIGNLPVTRVNRVIPEVNTELVVESVLQEILDYKSYGLDDDETLEDFIDTIQKTRSVGRIRSDIWKEKYKNLGVFKLPEVLSVFPEFLSNLGNHCFVTIPNFQGTVQEYEHPEEGFNIIGVGSTNFFTI